MKTERITVLSTPEFKAYLAQEAEREGVSVSELIRRRCENAPTEDEVLLLELARQVRLGAKEAEQALRQGLAAAETMLARVEKVSEPV